MTETAPRIEGPRVRLRPRREDDGPLIEPLRPEAGRPGGDCETLVITRTGEDLPIGVLEYRIDDPTGGSATIAWVALTEGARRWGLGVDAVLIFEEEAERHWRVRQFLVPVPVQRGLALYFWLRLGYHPLDVLHDEQGNKTIPMIRDVEPS